MVKKKYLYFISYFILLITLPVMILPIIKFVNLWFYNIFNNVIVIEHRFYEEYYKFVSNLIVVIIGYFFVYYFIDRRIVGKYFDRYKYIIEEMKFVLEDIKKTEKYNLFIELMYLFDTLNELIISMPEIRLRMSNKGLKALRLINSCYKDKILANNKNNETAKTPFNLYYIDMMLKEIKKLQKENLNG